MGIFEAVSFFLVGVMSGILFSVLSFVLLVYFAGRITVAEITAANYIRIEPATPGASGTPENGQAGEIIDAEGSRKAQDALAWGGALPLRGGISAANDDLYAPRGRFPCRTCRAIKRFFQSNHPNITG